MDSIRKGSYGAFVSMLLLADASLVSGFVPNANLASAPTRISESMQLKATLNDENNSSMSRRSAFGSLAGLASMIALAPTAANADEYGRETEMAFLSTGETVMICTKRGPLGRCEKTERRTADNENDKSEKYFRQPTELVKRKDIEARQAESSEGNILIERLKKQSEENKETNDLLVYQRTLLNDSVSTIVLHENREN